MNNVSNDVMIAGIAVAVSTYALTGSMKDTIVVAGSHALAHYLAGSMMVPGPKINGASITVMGRAPTPSANQMKAGLKQVNQFGFF